MGKRPVRIHGRSEAGCLCRGSKAIPPIRVTSPIVSRIPRRPPALRRGLGANGNDLLVSGCCRSHRGLTDAIALNQDRVGWSLCDHLSRTCAYAWSRPRGAGIALRRIGSVAGTEAESGRPAILGPLSKAGGRYSQVDLRVSFSLHLLFGSAYRACVRGVSAGAIGESCREFIDLNEPLNHNKAAFALRFLGPEKVNALKSLCRELNSPSNNLRRNTDFSSGKAS